MEGGKNVLEAIFEEKNLDDVDMFDAESLEEGECEDQRQCTEVTEVPNKKAITANPEPENVIHIQCRKKKRNRKKKKKTGSVPIVTDINRYVHNTCKRLKEKKPYLIWNAVRCLGVSAFTDLVKEVEAIQACGGQTTTDGRRNRFGGGILWNILKTRDPKAYKEVMTKGKEIEKQFRNQLTLTSPTRDKRPAPELTVDYGISRNNETLNLNKGSQQAIHQVQKEVQQSSIHGERMPALDRIRVPVTYDDLFEDNMKQEQPEYKIPAPEMTVDYGISHKIETLNINDDSERAIHQMPEEVQQTNMREEPIPALRRICVPVTYEHCDI